MNTIELIKVMERRPGMYVEAGSLASLYSFVRGDYSARSQALGPLAALALPMVGVDVARADIMSRVAQ